MARKLTFLILALILAPLVVAQTSNRRKAVVVSDWDIEGNAANNQLVVAQTNVVDSTTYTLTGTNPDMPRPLTVYITDADSSIVAGTVTIVGTNDADQAITATTVSLAGGTGDKTLTPIYNWKTVTSVSNGAITGETAGTDKIQVGTLTAANCPYSFTGVYGPDGTIWSEGYKGSGLIKTSGSSTTVTSVATTDPAFTNVAVGDELRIKMPTGTTEYRYVATRVSADEITVNRAITIPSTGTSFQYLKRRGTLVESEQGWFYVDRFNYVNFAVTVDQMSGTGNLELSIRCRVIGTTTPGEVVVASNNFTAAATYTYSTTVPWDQCRVGLHWQTNDDATDTTTAQEKVSVIVEGRYENVF